ncbi:hypothetical protein ACSS6W_007728 [Trichoderma asperelloides]
MKKWTGPLLKLPSVALPFRRAISGGGEAENLGETFSQSIYPHIDSGVSHRIESHRIVS